MGSDYNSVTPGFIESSGMDYIALGHIHKHTEIRRLGKTFYAYPGCPEGMGFDELGEKGVYIGEISKGGNSLEFLPTARRMRKIRGESLQNRAYRHCEYNPCRSFKQARLALLYKAA